MTAYSPFQSPLTRALAAACVLAVSACGSDSPQSLIEAGKAALASSDAKTATIQFKTALQKDPSMVEARVLLGQALLEGSDPAGAVLELNKALDQKAAPVRVVPLLARAMLLTGEYKKLVDLYSNVALDDKRAQGELNASLAAAWGALGDREKTEAAAAKALELAPDLPAALILNARLLAGRQKYTEALAVVEKLLGRDERQYEAWVLKGEILDVSKNDLAGAEACFRKALVAQPAYLPAHGSIIGLHVRNRNFDAARAQAAEVKKLLPNHPASMFIDAQIAFLDRDLARARELTQKILKAAPNHAGTLQLAGSIEGQMGSNFAAEAHFAKALQINPQLSVARRGLARIYLLQGQPDKALQALKPMLEAPGSANAADAFALAGEAELRAGNAERAEASFREAAKLAPDNLRVRTAVALTRLRRGEVNETFAELEALAATSADTVAEQAIFSARLKRREFAEAMRALDAIEKKRPGQALTAEMRGNLLQSKQDLVGARAAFTEALKRDPASFSAVRSLARIDLIERKPKDAAQRFEAALKTDPRNHLAAVALAELRGRDNAPLEEIRSLLQNAIAAAPQEPGPRLSLISWLLRKRLYKEALVAAQEASSALPNDKSVLDAVGRAQLQSGDVEQAISTFRKIAGADPNNAAAYVRLAETYRVAGKSDLAENSLRKAIELDPNLMPAHRALIEILTATKRGDQVLKYIQQLQTNRPDQPVGFVLEAGYQIQKKNPEAAIQIYRKALAKFQDTGIARGLHKLLAESGRHGDAEKFANDWLKSHPTDAGFEFQVASVAIDRGDLGDAEKRLRSIARRYPDNILVLNNLAWVLASRGDAGSMEFAQRVMDVWPDNPKAMDTMALALVANKQLSKALDLQKRAVELSPDDNGLRLSLARIALLAGDKSLAKTELQRLQAQGTKFEKQDEVTRLLKQV